MTHSRHAAFNDQVDYLMNRLDMKLVIPKMVVENEWNFRGTQAYSLYVTREKPLYFIQPLYDMFKDYLESEGTDPDDSVNVGGKTNRHPPRKILDIKTQYMNRSAMATGRRRRVQVPIRHLVVRLKENGLTFNFWTRAVKIFVFKDHSLGGAEPSQFLYNTLERLEYPRYVAADAVRKGSDIIGKLARLINTIKEKNARGWPMIL